MITESPVKAVPQFRALIWTPPSRAAGANRPGHSVRRTVEGVCLTCETWVKMATLSKPLGPGRLAVLLTRSRSHALCHAQRTLTPPESQGAEKDRRKSPFLEQIERGNIGQIHLVLIFLTRLCFGEAVNKTRNVFLPYCPI